MFVYLAVLCSCETNTPQSNIITPTATSSQQRNANTAATEPGVSPILLYSAEQIAKWDPTYAGSIDNVIDHQPSNSVVAVMNVLERFLIEHAMVDDNPWALTHGVLALGIEQKTVSGGNPLETLFDYAEVKHHNELSYTNFPRKTNKGNREILVEPHSDLIAKVLSERRVAMNTPAKSTDEQTLLLKNHYQGLLWRTHLNPKTNQSSFASPNDMAWGTQALLSLLPPGSKWVSEGKLIMDINQLAMFIIAILAQETKPLKLAMNSNAAIEKNGKGIFKYTCGGSHLLQTAAHVVANGYGNEHAARELQQQISLHFYRLPQELSIYDAALKKHPEHKHQLLIQRLKFTGHFVETSMKFQKLGLLTPTQRQQTMIDGAVKQIILVVEALRQDGVFSNIEKLKTDNHQLYLDLIGDSAHALYALKLMYSD